MCDSGYMQNMEQIFLVGVFPPVGTGTTDTCSLLRCCRERARLGSELLGSKDSS